MLSKVRRGGASLTFLDTIDLILRGKRATDGSILQHSYARKTEGNGHVSEGYAVCPGWANTGSNRDCIFQGPPFSNALCPMGTGKLLKSLEIAKKKKKVR